MRYRWKSLLILILLSGCVTQPVPVTKKEIREQAANDKELLAITRQPVTGPISIHEAMARALAFNLDLKLERYKSNLVETQLDLSRHDQLPELVLDHTADGRSNFSGGSSQSLITGEESLEFSTSSERYTKLDDLGMGWDILDFGLSYYRSKQAADRVLLAQEQQRNVVNRILTDVQKAYWRASSYQHLIQKLELLMQKVRQKLDESRQIEAQGLDTPLTALIYQRELIDNTRELYELYEGLNQAKIELAFLMNLAPHQEFDLVLYDKPRDVPPLPFEPEVMEAIALENRSELREVTYQKRISSHEVKAAYVNMLPGINLNYAHNYNSNNFLFNADWTDYSARVSWNLIGLFRYPDTKRLAQVQSDTFDAQRLALSAAVLTQVHVGVAKYHHSRTEYLIASDLHRTQDKILNQIQLAVAADSSSEQTLIREEMNALLAEVRYDNAYANLEEAFADLYSAMGLNPTLEELNATNLETLTASLERYFDARRKQELP